MQSFIEIGSVLFEISAGIDTPSKCEQTDAQTDGRIFDPTPPPLHALLTLWLRPPSPCTSVRMIYILYYIQIS